MTEANSIYNHLDAKFTRNNIDVAAGKMMSAPALKCKGKVFAFFYNDAMGFKLGKEFEPAT